MILLGTLPWVLNLFIHKNAKLMHGTNLVLSEYELFSFHYNKKSYHYHSWLEGNSNFITCLNTLALITVIIKNKSHVYMMRNRSFHTIWKSVAYLKQTLPCLSSMFNHVPSCLPGEPKELVLKGYALKSRDPKHSRDKIWRAIGFVGR